MPLVTVASRPYGDPIATTFSPTPRLADLPIVAGVSPETSSACTSAVSVSGSVPTTSAVGLAAVVERHRDLAAVTGDLGHVVVGEDQAVGVEDDARPGAGALVALDVELHDRRQHAVGHLLDRAVGGGGVGSVDDLRRGGRAAVVRRGAAAVVVEGVEGGGSADPRCPAHQQRRGEHRGREGSAARATARWGRDGQLLGVSEGVRRLGGRGRERRWLDDSCPPASRALSVTTLKVAFRSPRETARRLDRVRRTTAMLGAVGSPAGRLRRQRRRLLRVGGRAAHLAGRRGGHARPPLRRHDPSSGDLRRRVLATGSRRGRPPLPGRW